VVAKTTHRALGAIEIDKANQRSLPSVSVSAGGKYYKVICATRRRVDIERVFGGVLGSRHDAIRGPQTDAPIDMVLAEVGIVCIGF
jgi:hypothetical protein